MIRRATTELKSVETPEIDIEAKAAQLSDNTVSFDDTCLHFITIPPGFGAVREFVFLAKVQALLYKG